MILQKYACRRFAALLASREQTSFPQFLAGPVPVNAQEEAAALIGRHVGQYVIDSEVGSGGMGSVWRAHRADGRYQGSDPYLVLEFVEAEPIDASYAFHPPDNHRVAIVITSQPHLH
jgi:hypothetical protein